MGLFKVTPSFVQGERHVEMARPFSEEDFVFSVRPYESVDPVGGIKVGVEVSGMMDPVLHAELVKVFPKDCPPRFDRYQRETFCEALAAGRFRISDGVENDYRGCRDEKSRKAKADRVLPEMRAMAQKLVPGMRAAIVKRINEVVADLAGKDNESYARSAFQNLTRAWDGLREAAGVEDKMRQAAEARATARRLDAEVRAELNAFALKDMEADGWEVNGKPLAGPVVEELKAIYARGEAFGDDRLNFRR